MAKFCSFCGKMLEEGAACDCEESKKAQATWIGKVSARVNKEKAKGFWESLKNRMGLGDPERNSGDAYERDRATIVPDCVSPNDGEIPVKQYEIATLRNRVLGIPYIKATGRLQVTNKRVIFRAPGRCLAGRTTLQHEFAIDEVSGVEARREYAFSFWDMIVAFLVAWMGMLLPYLVLSLMQDVTAASIFGFLFGVAGCVPFFLVNKKWLSKLLCLGGAVAGFAVPAIEYDKGFFIFLMMFPLVFTYLTIFFYAIKPNLVLVIKTKGASEAIDIRRRRIGIFAQLFGVRSSEKEDHTGFSEIIPACDAERCIREIDAIINDIQKLGDFGVEKWKV